MLGLRYSRFKKTTISFFILAAFAALLAFYLFFSRIAIYFISKSYDLNVTYGRVKNETLSRFIFDNLKIMDRKRGVGIFSKYAILRPKWIRFPRDFTVDFELYDVRFITEEPSKETYDSIAGLVSIPFAGRWAYRKINGGIQSLKRGLRVKDLTAISDEIRLSFTGDLYYNNVIKSDIVICFSKELTQKIPDVLSNVVLQEEPAGWKSLSLSLSGDYKAPSIQVSSKLFRLKVNTISHPPH